MDDEQFFKISKTLADPRRYEILRRIAKAGDICCSDLRCKLSISPATLSHHIKELTNAGLLEVRRDSRFLYMKLRRKLWQDYVRRLKEL